MHYLEEAKCGEKNFYLSRCHTVQLTVSNSNQLLSLILFLSDYSQMKSQSH